MKWKPIETAPKDGTRILAKCFEDYTQVVYCVPDLMDYPVWKSEQTDKFVMPEQWMPLPEPPQEKADE